MDSSPIGLHGKLRVLIDARRITPGADGSGRRAAIYIDLVALGDPSVGARIRAIRVLAKLTQDELAEKAGIRQIEISRVENQPNKTSLRVFGLVCEALECTLSDILEDMPKYLR